MATRKKLVFGLGTFGLILGIILMIFAMGQYERSRRGEREAAQREKFAELNEKISKEAREALEKLPLMHKERVQPFDSIARSKIRQMSGKRSLYGVPASLFLGDMLFNDAFDWENTPLFYVSHQKNKERLGVESVDSLATLKQIEDSKELMAALADAQTRIDSNATTSIDNEVFTLMGLSRQARAHFHDILLLVPPARSQYRSETPDYLDWHLVGEAESAGHDPALAKELDSGLRALKTSFQARDSEGIVAAVARMHSAIEKMSPVPLPTDREIDLELSFNRVNPFFYASWIFFVTAALGIFAFAFSKKWLRNVGWGVSLLGLALMAWGFYARTVLGFHVTITNLYESMAAVAAGIMLIGVCIGLMRHGALSLALAGLGAFVVLQSLDTFSVKFDSGIGGTIAVLANNIWVHIHVPVVMLAYAGYFLAFLASLIGLPWVLFGDRRAADPDLKMLLRVSTIAVNVGSVLMFAGLILGGIWAYDSWGRFWGWDPKETWALMLFIYYMVVVHGRFTKWLDPFWTMMSLFFGGLVLLWTYYGTNELLSGLHSYANSAGGAGFWDNFVHERNRWFVGTTIAHLLLTAAGITVYFVTGGAKGGAGARVGGAASEGDRDDLEDETRGLVEPS